MMRPYVTMYSLTMYSAQHNTMPCVLQFTHYGTCGSPFLAGLGQHLPPVVAQQYPHVPGILQSARRFPPTDIVHSCVWQQVQQRLISPVYIHSADSTCS